MGEGKEDGYVCHYGLGYRNDHRGQMLVAFAQQDLWQTPGLHSTEEDVDTPGRSLETQESNRYIVSQHQRVSMKTLGY